MSKRSARSSVDRVEKEDLVLKLLFESQIDLISRRIQLVGEVNEEMFKLVDAALSYFEAKSITRQITLVINSGGGDVYEALGIVGRIKRSPCKIITEGFGSIMSAATLIFAAGNSRRLSRFAVFMHHESTYELDGRHSELKAQIKQKDTEEKLWADAMAGFSNASSSYWLNEGVSLDRYFSPEELVALGVVDKIL